MKTYFRMLSACALLAGAVACTKSATPSRPTETASAENTASVTDAKSGITLTTPAPVTPAGGAQIRFAEQPITLTIRNAVSTGASALTYTFQVASDGAFASIVSSRDSVAEGPAGQTSVTLDKLPGAKSYYWRARANGSGVAGFFTTPRAFTVGPEVVLQQPVLVSPAQNGTATGSATLTVSNIQRSGPAGPITYRFELADSSAFSNVVFSTTVAEQSGGQTSVTANANLTSGATYYWRVQAIDATNSLTTPFSSTFSFQFIAFSLAKATIWDNPPDFKDWAETAQISSVVFTPGAILVDFDRRLGPDRWPDVGFGSGSLQYTLGMCVNIRGDWHCSATIQFWYGRELEASGLPSEIGINWWYDARWGALLGYQPSQGEQVGIYVAAGNLRDSGNVIVKERSNIVLMPFGGTYFKK